MTPLREAPPPARPTVLQLACGRLFLWVVPRVLGWCCRLKILSYENVPRDSVVIFVCNHGSHYDLLLVYEALRRSDPRPAVPLAWYRLLEYFGLGNGLKSLQAIPVNNEDGAEATAMRAGVLRSMLHHLQAGRNLWVHPEGVRTDALAHFHEGSALVALLAQKPLVPVSLCGVQPLFKDFDSLPKLFGRVTLIFHPPLHPRDASGRNNKEKAVDLMARARAVIARSIDYPDALATSSPAGMVHSP